MRMMMEEKMEKKKMRMEKRKRKRTRVMEEFNQVQESEPAELKEGRAFRLFPSVAETDTGTGPQPHPQHEDEGGKVSAGRPMHCVLCRWCPPRQGTSCRMAGRQVPWASFNLPDFSGCRAGEHTRLRVQGLCLTRTVRGWYGTCIEKEWQDPSKQRTAQRQVDRNRCSIQLNSGQIFASPPRRSVREEAEEDEGEEKKIEKTRQLDYKI
ncbi:hypothetical protein TWF481_011363 [Arthrobotrys musiformis]|uniref:Uncharacterized protein n=1 Tax=Arthrobotrys musiformis TaxID=47236 RepID=A0AAV9VZY8_9PEZI